MASSSNLGTHLESFVTEMVRNGRYGSRSEVIREGVRLVEEREKRLAALDAALKRGLEQSEAGLGKPAGDVFDRLERKCAVGDGRE